VSKGSILFQVAWFVLQLISRVIYHLEITQLEAETLAFAVLNFITYVVWWHKHLDVKYSHLVYWKLTESELKGYISIHEHAYAPISYIATDYVYHSIPEDDPLTVFKIFTPVFCPLHELMGGFVITYHISKAPSSNI
ncbi:hypothetical protein DFJ58DRAFT_663033, partial [Suillus subalutaceus]|uniref:uncharacterized protein n=1 Tax=Suillus subalutaceus TaxID=48586 RepID=UPI001B866BB6